MKNKQSWRQVMPLPDSDPAKIDAIREIYTVWKAAYPTTQVTSGTTNELNCLALDMIGIVLDNITPALIAGVAKILIENWALRHR